MNSSGTRTITSASPHPMVFFNFSGSGEGDDLIIRGIDNTGKAFQATEWVGEPGVQMYKLEVATNATTLDLQMIVHQTYHAEFNVKPPSRIQND